jgi:hypothetical protein
VQLCLLQVSRAKRDILCPLKFPWNELPIATKKIIRKRHKFIKNEAKKKSQNVGKSQEHDFPLV